MRGHPTPSGEGAQRLSGAGGALEVERSLRGRTVLFRLEGELGAAGAGRLARQLEEAFSGIVEAVVLHLEACDVEGPVAATHLVSALKRLLDGGCRVALYGPPQALAHNLYRLGLTRPGGRLRLLGGRLDEATSP